MPISPFSIIIAALNSKYSVQKWWDYMLQPLLQMVNFRNTYIILINQKCTLLLSRKYPIGSDCSWLFFTFFREYTVCTLLMDWYVQTALGKKLKAFSRLTVEIHEVVRILFNHITKTFWLFEWPKKVQESWATTN